MVKHDSLYWLYKRSSPHVASLHCRTVKVYKVSLFSIHQQILLVDVLDVSKLAAAEQRADARNI